MAIAVKRGFGGGGGSQKWQIEGDYGFAFYVSGSTTYLSIRRKINGAYVEIGSCVTSGSAFVEKAFRCWISSDGTVRVMVTRPCVVDGQNVDANEYIIAQKGSTTAAQVYCSINVPLIKDNDIIISGGLLNKNYTLTGNYNEGNDYIDFRIAGAELTNFKYDKFAKVTFDYLNDNGSYAPIFLLKDGKSRWGANSTARNTLTINTSAYNGTDKISLKKQSNTGITYIYNMTATPRSTLTDNEIIKDGEFNPKYELLGYYSIYENGDYLSAKNDGTNNTCRITGVDMTNLTTLKIDCQNGQSSSIRLSITVNGNKTWSLAGNGRQEVDVDVSGLTGLHDVILAEENGQGYTFLFNIIAE
ncbi:MAG: hypothetical protein J6U37_05640 [Lachnospiraceae bacterium]|nr:hypothetical protein [Lachnospiraceae bacterium]